jgi:hypothetical protein
MVSNTIVDTIVDTKGWSIYQPNIGFNVIVPKFSFGGVNFYHFVFFKSIVIHVKDFCERYVPKTLDLLKTIPKIAIFR